jgi:segregation and condensation protein B
MSDKQVRNLVEAALLAAGRSVTVNELLQLFDPLGRPAPEVITTALADLAEDYVGRGIEVKETASGFRVQVRRDLAAEISRLWPERPQKYSRALLETLALIAYRQPLTRAEIEAVRGVAVNPNIVKTLLERGWIRVVGHRDLPGRPELLGTTREFLDYFGLKSLDDLPPLAELRALSDLDPQMELPPPVAAIEIGAAAPADEEPAALAAAAAADTDAAIEVNAQEVAAGETVADATVVPEAAVEAAASGSDTGAEFVVEVAMETQADDGREEPS